MEASEHSVFFENSSHARRVWGEALTLQTDARPLGYFTGSLDSLYSQLTLQSQGRACLPPHFFNIQTVVASVLEGSRWHTAVRHIWSCRDQKKAQKPVEILMATLEACLQRFGVVPLTLYPDPILDRLHVFPSFSTPPLHSNFNWIRWR